MSQTPLGDVDVVNYANALGASRIESRSRGQRQTQSMGTLERGFP